MNKSEGEHSKPTFSKYSEIAHTKLLFSYGI